MKMEEKTPQKMGVWNSMCYTVQTIWRADKGCILLSFYKNCTEEVYMSFFFILMLQMIYSYIESGRSFMGLLRFVTLFCLGHICIHLVSAWHAYYIRRKTPKVYAYIFNRVIDKAVRIELTKYEQPDFYDRFARALDECLTKAMDGLHSLTWATGCALSAVAAIFLIARVDPMMLVFSLPSIVASFLFSSRINKLQYELRLEETRDKRAAEYVKLANECIRDILSRGKLPIIVGGTGLYIDSLLDNVRFSEVKNDEAYRQSLYDIARTQGNDVLYAELLEKDPEAAASEDPA